MATAWFLFLAGLVMVGTGFALLFDVVPPEYAEIATDVLAGRSVDEAIDRGMLAIGIGITLGVLCQIARNTAPRGRE